MIILESNICRVHVYAVAKFWVFVEIIDISERALQGASLVQSGISDCHCGQVFVFFLTSL